MNPVVSASFDLKHRFLEGQNIRDNIRFPRGFSIKNPATGLIYLSLPLQHYADLDIGKKKPL